MTHELGYYTGWTIALVLLFVFPLIYTFIVYLRRINHQLADIRDRLLLSSTGKRGRDGNAKLKNLSPRGYDGGLGNDNFSHNKQDESTDESTDEFNRRTALLHSKG